MHWPVCPARGLNVWRVLLGVVVVGENDIRQIVLCQVKNKAFVL